MWTTAITRFTIHSSLSCKWIIHRQPWRLGIWCWSKSEHCWLATYGITPLSKVQSRAVGMGDDNLGCPLQWNNMEDGCWWHKETRASQKAIMITNKRDEGALINGVLPFHLRRERDERFRCGSDNTDVPTCWTNGGGCASPPWIIVDSICRRPRYETTTSWWPVRCPELGLGGASGAGLMIGEIKNCALHRCCDSGDGEGVELCPWCCCCLEQGRNPLWRMPW
jgi:hypothetical protein